MKIMDKNNQQVVRKTAQFWEKTEGNEAQIDAMAVLTNYTSKLLKRVQKLDIPIRTQHQDRSLEHDNPISSKKIQSERLETGQKGSEFQDELKDILEIGEKTVSLEKLVNIFDQGVVTSASMDFSKPTFFGLIPASGHLLYATADYIASLTHILPIAPFVNKVQADQGEKEDCVSIGGDGYVNVAMPSGDIWPDNGNKNMRDACDIEESVINWVKKIVGYPDTANGVTVSGTSMGVVVAFSAARDHLLKSSNLYSRAVVYVADHTHLSGIRALRVVGLGDCVYRYVPSDKHRIISPSLDEMIKEDIRQGLVPFLVIASMGGTCVGALDPLSEIREITQKHNVWFHVDASYGGFLLLEETVKARCRGINKADSITLDCHKGLSAPPGSAVLLIREGPILTSSMSRSTPYIQNVAPGTGYSPMDLSFEYTRPFRAFPIWFLLKVVGTDAVKSQITEKIKLTQYAYEILSQMENVSVYMEPDLTIVAFRCSKGDDMTRKWLEMINQEGTICTTSTTIDGQMYIRMCILSFRTHLNAVEIALSSFKRTLNVLIRKGHKRKISKR